MAKRTGPRPTRSAPKKSSSSKASSRPAKARGGARRKRAAKARGSVGPGTSARQRPVVVTRPLIELGQVWTTIRPRLPAEFRVHVRRPDDLLVIDLLFENLKVEPGAVPRLVKKNPAATAAIIVEFPPQSFGEQAFLEVSGSEPAAGDKQKEASDDLAYPPKNNQPPANENVTALPGAKIRISGRSRVAFLMPPAISGLDYTLADVLRAMRTWKMRLDTTAAPEPGRVLRARPEVSEVLDFNRNWLKAMTASESWTAMSEMVSSALTAIGARGVNEAVDVAARRLSGRAAEGLAAADRQLSSVLTEALRSEVNAIVARQPRLAAEGGRDLVTAAVSIAATSGLSNSAAQFDFNLAAMPLIPFLPILMTPHEPAPGVTALELPYRVILSPLTPARWLHRDLAFESNGRTELWHTRLTTASQDFGPDGPSKVRAIWSPDYASWTPQFDIDNFIPLLELPPKPFRMGLDPLDRAMLVRLMAGFTDTRLGKPYHPRASRARKLHLSSLGGSADIEGNWPQRPTGIDLEQWRHIASLGRDQYVRVVYTGFLCGLPHAASLIKVTERKFESIGADIRQQRVAILRQSYYILTRERIKDYSGQNHKFAGRNFPFKQVEILTTVTPKLLDPADSRCRLEKGDPGDPDIYGGKVVQRMVFWPMVSSTSGSGAADFPFEVALTDICGKRKTTAMPLLFVGEVANDTKDAAIRTAYNKSAPSKRRGDFGGATICFAPFTAGDKGDPRLPADRLTIAAGALRDGVHFPLDPNYYPEIDRAWVGIRPVQKLLNKPNAVVKVTYPNVYKNHGFGEQDPSQNKGKLFLQLAEEVHQLEFGESPNAAKSDGLGALAAPQMTIQGLSRTMGPVAAQAPADLSKPENIEAALGNIIGDSFNPTDFFKDASVLGGIKLKDILTIVPALTGADVPKMLSRDLEDAVEASFSWDTEIKQPDPLNLLLPNADSSKPKTHLKIDAVTRTPFKDPAGVEFTAFAEMKNFKVNLFGFVIIWFETLRFTSTKGQKPDVAVQLRQGNDAVQFGGALEFVNQLRDVIPSNGFSDPPAITVTPSGIQAGYSLTLPAIGVGIFTLSGVSLGAGFTLPFDSTPAQVRFNFSDREHTFSLTVSMLGGGGFFAIGISSAGVNEIEAALEFGAAVAIDLGVASGGVEIKAGVYFHWLEPQPNKGSIDLAGYVRLHGELSVLGIISASLTFNLQLTYHKDSSKTLVWGEATLVVEIDVLLFSGEVSVRCRKDFGGSEDADPKFIDLIPDQTTWDEYCAAFAQEAA
jgi:hypothetical protein